MTQARKRILAIDDDAGIRSLLSHVLRRSGYEVALAVDGAEGLRSIEALAPDLVLCDLHMPVMDGFAMLELVRAKRSSAGVPFILLTAMDDRRNVLRGLRLGVDDFLSKPVRPEALVESVREALERRDRGQ
jgi:DNA-binding response OmpR family regulator